MPNDNPNNPFDPGSSSTVKPPDGGSGTTPTTGGTTPDPPIKPQNPTEAKKQAAVDGVNSVVPLAPNATNQLAAGVSPLPVVSLQLKAVDQKELRTVSIEYNSRKATQRTYRPQGFFGLSDQVLAALPKNAFMEVDTNNEFWRKLDVRVHGPQSEDYTKLGLSSAVAQIDYGDQGGGVNFVSKSYRFDSAQPGGSQTFSNPMIHGGYDYRYGLTYVYNSGWTGDPAQRDLAPVSTKMRDVFVLPQRDFKFVTVSASFTDTPDWNKLSQIHLFLTCRSHSETWPESFEKPPVVIHSGWTPSLVPSEPAGPLPWNVRFKDPDPKARVTVQYRLEYIYKDGQRVKVAADESTDPNLVLLPAPPGGG